MDREKYNKYHRDYRAKRKALLPPKIKVSKRKVFLYGVCPTCGGRFDKRTKNGRNIMKNKIYCCRKCVTRTEEWRKKISEAQKGEKSYNWQGGKTEENKRIRKSVEFRLWREAVFSRDNWTCVECGVKSGELHPHHIKSFSEYPELRFAIDNGVTLCKKCHKKTPNYARNIK